MKPLVEVPVIPKHLLKMTGLSPNQLSFDNPSGSAKLMPDTKIYAAPSQIFDNCEKLATTGEDGERKLPCNERFLFKYVAAAMRKPQCGENATASYEFISAIIHSREKIGLKLPKS
jgi:hypothetical protein